MPTPEALARDNIDRLLSAAGWVIQDRGAVGEPALPFAITKMGVPPGDAILYPEGSQKAVV